jgi:hypothetical protein
MTQSETIARYAGYVPDNVSFEEDFERAQRSLAGMGNSADLAAWTEQNTRRLVYGERNYNMLVHRPATGDPNKVVVIGGEFGNGLTPAVAARSRVVRDIVAPEATLVVQPNSTIFEDDHMNYSREERLTLRSGEALPLIGRIATTLDALHNPEDITMFGPSQGGTAVLAYAAHRWSPDGIATAVVETPNVVNRSSAQLLANFVGSGGQLKDIIAENFADPSSQLKKEIIAATGLAGFVRFGLGIATRRNRVLRGIMREDTAYRNMAGVLYRGGSVVHAWGNVNSVSPAGANESFRSHLDVFPRYESVKLEDKDHSVTNNYVLAGTLAKSARRLLGKSLI